MIFNGNGVGIFRGKVDMLSSLINRLEINISDLYATRM
jgi:hypothetical protein